MHVFTGLVYILLAIVYFAVFAGTGEFIAVVDGDRSIIYTFGGLSICYLFWAAFHFLVVIDQTINLLSVWIFTAAVTGVSHALIEYQLYQQVSDYTFTGSSYFFMGIWIGSMILTGIAYLYTRQQESAETVDLE